MDFELNLSLSELEDRVSSERLRTVELLDDTSDCYKNLSSAYKMVLCHLVRAGAYIEKILPPALPCLTVEDNLRCPLLSHSVFPRLPGRTTQFSGPEANVHIFSGRSAFMDFAGFSENQYSAEKSVENKLRHNKIMICFFIFIPQFLRITFCE